MLYFTAWLSVDWGNPTDSFWQILAIAWYATKNLAMKKNQA